jgi:hypothetical protein
VISEEDAVITTEIVADETGEIRITRVERWIEGIPVCNTHLRAHET